LLQVINCYQDGELRWLPFLLLEELGKDIDKTLVRMSTPLTPSAFEEVMLNLGGEPAPAPQPTPTETPPE